MIKLKDLLGTVIPYIGWREYDHEDIDDISEVIPEVDSGRRYSGFQVAWLGILYGNGLKDIGPRE